MRRMFEGHINSTAWRRVQDASRSVKASISEGECEVDELNYSIGVVCVSSRGSKPGIE
jgi:hypothetical protein